MAEQSNIQWTDHTFNPWWGCTKVSPGCEHCYAETLAVIRRQLPVWGPAPRFGRKSMSEGYWKGPEKWNRKAEAEGIRYRVFCASMADVFDEHPDVVEHRARLWDLIERTPRLDWQLLTKRPGNVMEMVPESWRSRSGFPRNVWIGTSVEDQRRADERIPILLRIPTAVRFLSCEPLIGPVDLTWWMGALDREASGLVRDPLAASLLQRGMDEGRASAPTLGERLHWVIAGGESGPGARPCDVAWIRSLVRQCRAAAVPVFVKQLGASWYEQLALVDPRDRKGGDPSEWPEDLRVRQFPDIGSPGPSERSEAPEERWRGAAIQAKNDLRAIEEAFARATPVGEDGPNPPIGPGERFAEWTSPANTMRWIEAMEGREIARLRAAPDAPKDTEPIPTQGADPC